MTIKSDFRDYYDIGQKHGYDRFRVYERQPKKLTGPAIPEECAPLLKIAEDIRRPGSLIYAGRYDGLTISCWLLAFCGRIYPCYELDDEYRHHWRYRQEIDPEQCTCTFRLDGILEKCKHTLERSFRNPTRLYKKAAASFNQKPSKSSASNFSVREVCERILEKYHGMEVPHSIFQAVGSPIFFCRRDSLVVNPRLADTDFIKIMSPMQAFQEIEMYLGGPLAPPDIAPRTVGDDKLLAQQKGFDEQSFRQVSPGDKKLRRKENRARKRKERGESEA